MVRHAFAKGSIVLHVKCPECSHPKVAVVKTRDGYFVRAHRMGTIVKHRCPMSRAKVPIQIGMKIV